VPVHISSGLADASNGFLLAAVLLYALAMLAYACDFAFRKERLLGTTSAAGASAAPAPAPAPAPGTAPRPVLIAGPHCGPPASGCAPPSP
jgi:hypothetical protein